MYCYTLLLLPTLQLARAALKHWYTWNCSPSYARITSSLKRLFVAFAGTKHCCLTAINRDGALCCPDFPRRRGLKPQFFFPYSAIDRCTIFKVRFWASQLCAVIFFAISQLFRCIFEVTLFSRSPTESLVGSR